MDRNQIETLFAVGIMAPLAIYALRDKKPPRWLIASSLVYTVAVAFFDGRKLLNSMNTQAPQVTGQTVLPAPKLI